MLSVLKKGVLTSPSLQTSSVDVKSTESLPYKYQKRNICVRAFVSKLGKCVDEGDRHIKSKYNFNDSGIEMNNVLINFNIFYMEKDFLLKILTKYCKGLSAKQYHFLSN